SSDPRAEVDAQRLRDASEEEEPDEEQRLEAADQIELQPDDREVRRDEEGEGEALHGLDRACRLPLPRADDDTGEERAEERLNAEEQAQDRREQQEHELV